MKINSENITLSEVEKLLPTDDYTIINFRKNKFPFNISIKIQTNHINYKLLLEIFYDLFGKITCNVQILYHDVHIKKESPLYDNRYSEFSKHFPYDEISSKLNNIKNIIDENENTKNGILENYFSTKLKTTKKKSLKKRKSVRKKSRKKSVRKKSRKIKKSVRKKSRININF